ncbi:MarR family transcriptional regulator [Elizabethkingia meningoseptica]|uniref:MarR family transcriptional regulator n=1 Tax=Elizabethkingia meningoseptica TaxID=238 RepID=A0A1V3TWL2_ELIME|nr:MULTISPECIES: MarR family transcriptional regulator [Elizabethkingia]AQX12712.1 MarR family transcriptional regulator [Elizabethkingia meningoseptica]MBG0514224.1 winged helix DNA-binding protein [Elizabethkingia meningoseptica]MDE5433141.1 winged helix DNA-binding protein [Elizabethkingia meningoseptica]MDE5447441.1 winged helix DNA-binding protein [Elizabethkingia meningoseptica]MDE5471495.1 winged helix DNA-binding protein [Elizabethkingia meningoseptica]
MKTDFFIDLLYQVREFENSETYKPHSTVEDFRLWMNDKKYREESPTKLFKKEEQVVSFTENEICKQVLLLGRYSKQLIRKGLGDFPELANEEFTYLYRLKDEPNLTKIQLIERNGHEKQTGSQIIKRLLEYNLIEEKNDRDDKRSKRLNLTKKGEDYFHLSVEKVNLTSKILSGQLQEAEKNELLKILIKLNSFHAHLYTSYKNSDVETIYSTVL